MTAALRPIPAPIGARFKLMPSQRITPGDPRSENTARFGTGQSPIPGLRLADGRFLAAGLTWEKRTAISDLPQIGTARPRLKHGDRIARAGDRTVPSQAGSLLLALGAGLLGHLKPDEPREGVWLFTADLDGPQNQVEQGAALCWIALAELKRAGDDWIVQPLPRAETLHDSHEAAMDAILEHLGTADIAGLCHPHTHPGAHPGQAPDEIELLDQFTAVIMQNAPKLAQAGNTVTWAVTPKPDGLPVFTAPLHVSFRAAGVASLAGAALIAAALILPPLVAAAFRTPPPPAPALISVTPAPGGFADACAAGLSAWWPRITGWQAAGGGCALPRHLPPGLDIRIDPAQDGRLPVVIWQRLKRSGTANKVLASGAATRVLAGWNGGKSIEADSILLWQTGSIPLVDVDPDALTPLPEDASDRLAAIWAHLPNAVRSADTGAAGDDIIPPGSLIVQAPDTPAGLFARAARVGGLEPVRLDLAGPSNGQGETDLVNTLHLAPVMPRLVPAPEKQIGKGPSP